MQEDEFLNTVQRRTQVESTDEAHTIARATLDVLGQRITEGEAEDIASQLPETLDAALTSEDAEAEEFPAAEFVARVHTREVEEGAFDDPDSEAHVRAVMTVLGNAVSGSELDDARNQLPDEFESLFEPIDMSEQQL
jgi:uncharacterized protein (DUF2267 family)